MSDYAVIKPEVSVRARVQNVLGEGPIWCAEEKALYWVDNLKPSVWRYTPKGEKIQSWDMPEEIGSIVKREKGGFVAGMKSGFSFIDLDKGTIDLIVSPEADRPNNRLNDGRCDRAGRYWTGSMNANFKDGKHSAAIYRLDPDLTCHRMDDGFIVSNGIAFGHDNKKMYYADTTNRIVYVYDYDFATGGISNRQPFFDTRDMNGKVDGAAVDAEGYYWCAFVYDYAILRISPEGKIDRRYEVPIKNPTCVAFGGDDLKTLYFTSATVFMTDEELAAQPDAGGLFSFEVDVKGLPEPRFAG